MNVAVVVILLAPNGFPFHMTAAFQKQASSVVAMEVHLQRQLLVVVVEVVWWWLPQSV